MITKPMLPPRAGYVEAIDKFGNHVYRPTPETEARLAEKAAKAAAQDDLDLLAVDHEYRLTLLELGVENDAV